MQETSRVIAENGAMFFMSIPTILVVIVLTILAVWAYMRFIKKIKGTPFSATGKIKTPAKIVKAVAYAYNVPVPTTDDELQELLDRRNSYDDKIMDDLKAPGTTSSEDIAAANAMGYEITRPRDYMDRLIVKDNNAARLLSQEVEARKLAVANASQYQKDNERLKKDNESVVKENEELRKRLNAFRPTVMSLYDDMMQIVKKQKTAKSELSAEDQATIKALEAKLQGMTEALELSAKQPGNVININAGGNNRPPKGEKAA